MKTEWFAGIALASAYLAVVPAADGQEASPTGSAESPLAAAMPLSKTDLNRYAGGANTLVVEQGSLMVNDTSAAGTASNNTLSSVASGFVAGSVVSHNAGFTSVINNTGNAAGIAVNTSVIINLQ